MLCSIRTGMQSGQERVHKVDTELATLQKRASDLNTIFHALESSLVEINTPRATQLLAKSRAFFRDWIQEVDIVGKQHEAAVVRAGIIMLQSHTNLAKNCSLSPVCSLCMEHVVQVFSPSCGHCFCKSCVCRLSSDLCPFCRCVMKKLKDLHLS